MLRFKAILSVLSVPVVGSVGSQSSHSSHHIFAITAIGAHTNDYRRCGLDFSRLSINFCCYLYSLATSQNRISSTFMLVSFKNTHVPFCFLKASSDVFDIILHLVQDSSETSIYCSHRLGLPFCQGHLCFLTPLHTES